MATKKNGIRGERRSDGTTGTRRTRRRSHDSCRPVSISPGYEDRLLGASTRRRWLTLTTRSTSSTFTGAVHASQPFGGKPSQSARPARRASVYVLDSLAGRADERPRLAQLWSFQTHELEGLFATLEPHATESRPPRL